MLQPMTGGKRLGPARRSRGRLEPMGAPARKTGPCGWCGKHGKLSRTHAPPQSVGNRHEVCRYQIVSDAERTATAGRPLSGGLHVMGLCVACNMEAGARWDDGYRELHESLGPAWFDESGIVLPRAIHRIPDTPVRVGAAARSMLAAAFALNLNLRTTHPDLPDALRDRAPFDLPDDLDLRLAWAVGRRARTTGPIAGFRMLGPRVRRADGRDLPLGNSVMAQVHYAPIAWQLVPRDAASLNDVQRWASVGGWTSIEEDVAVPLTEHCTSLPLVWIPRDDPEWGWQWTELLSSEICFTVECDDIDPATSTSRL